MFLYNCGCDLGSIDTIYIYIPCRSKTIFLQALYLRPFLAWAAPDSSSPGLPGEILMDVGGKGGCGFGSRMLRSCQDMSMIS